MCGECLEDSMGRRGKLRPKLVHEFIHHRCTIFIDFMHAITSRERLFKLCKTSMSLDISGIVLCCM